MQLNHPGMNGYYPLLSEEEKLKNLIETCDDILGRYPGNKYWEFRREETQQRLEKIYQEGDLIDDMAAVATCAKHGCSL